MKRICVNDESLCCGCGACSNICPKNAITMSENDRGFIFPKINNTSCVSCGVCLDICPIQKRIAPTNSEEHQVCVCVHKDSNILQKSSSGGAFTALAQWIFEKNGVVVGCAWNSNLEPHHTIVSSMEELKKINGSKYVQSYTGFIYKKIEQYLKKGVYVLFSGTPCQCDALRSFLRNEYYNLYCVELVCHGVPSSKMFKQYISLLEAQIKGRIIDLNFRDKKRGWGALLRISYIGQDGKVKNKYLRPEESYYYYFYFHKNLFFRESCYSCKYANLDRKSDFTIGDFWGVQRIKTDFDDSKGVSLLIANGKRAISIIPELSKYLSMVETTAQIAQIENPLLKEPALRDDKYDELLKMYMDFGSAGFDKYYRTHYRSVVIKGKIKKIVPTSIKRQIFQIIRKRLDR